MFTKYKTIDYQYFEQLREKSPLLFHAHLMIEKPEKVINKYNVKFIENLIDALKEKIELRGCHE